MSEIRTTSATGGEKGVKPERYDLLPVEALDIMARLYGFGAEKYAAHNWRKGYEWSKSYASLMRHATRFWAGEDIDEETGLPHLAGVGFHAFTLMVFMQEHPDYDDRFKAAPARVEEDPFKNRIVEQCYSDAEHGPHELGQKGVCLGYHPKNDAVIFAEAYAAFRKGNATPEQSEHLRVAASEVVEDHEDFGGIGLLNEVENIKAVSFDDELAGILFESQDGIYRQQTWEELKQVAVNNEVGKALYANYIVMAREALKAGYVRHEGTKNE